MIKENNVNQFILSLRESGVKFWEENGKIKFKAPQGVMKPEHITWLKVHKEEVLSALIQEKSEIRMTEDLENRYEPFPLTDIQSAYLLGRSKSFAYGGIACHIYMEMEYPEIDVSHIFLEP